MDETHQLPVERIIKHLITDYGIAVISLSHLAWGADRDASVYKAYAEGGRSYFVKLKKGHQQDLSVAVLSLLQKSGIQQIIPPVQTIDKKSIQYIGDFTILVYPFVEGKNGFYCDLSGEQWMTLGNVLRQVHELDVPSTLKGQMRREVYSSKWQQAARALYTDSDADQTGDLFALKFQKFMRDYRETIHQLIDRAEQLSQKVRQRSVQFVLCHSDIHAGNVLIDENRAIYIVDWDAPILAPKERDLMFIGAGVANVWNDPQEEKLFYRGYGKSEIDWEIIAYYRYERIVEDIAIYGQEFLSRTARDEEKREMYQQFLAMFEPRGVVDRAFKTEEAF